MANPPAKTFAKYTPHEESVPMPQQGTWSSRVLARKLTHASERPPSQLVEMKVLCLGLPRTATTSLRKAMYELGYYDVYHMATLFEGTQGEKEMWIRAANAKLYNKGTPLTQGEWYQLLGYCEVLTDYPPAAFVEELMALYPDAKLILTTRDTAASWYQSMRDTLAYARELTWFLNRTFWADLFVSVVPIPSQLAMLRPLLDQAMGPTNDVFEKEWQQRYDNHNELVRRLAREQGRELLEFNAKQGWEPLCRYLDKDVPTGPFPRVNDTKQWRARIEKARAIGIAEQKAAFRRKAILGVQVAAAVGVAAAVYKRYLGAGR